MKREELKDVKRVVVKVGTSTLTYDTGLLNLSRIEALVRQVADVHNKGLEMILVSSGAIGAGMGKLNLTERPKTIPEKQAAAAVGQGVLMHMYQKCFSEYGKTIGQILLTKNDFSDRSRFLTARDAFFQLLRQGVIPIVNENDAIVVDEIKVGDNDTLSALVASLVEADLLIILSDIDGLYTANPAKDSSAKKLDTVVHIDDDIRSMASGAGSELGTGGMATKITAAQVATSAGVHMVIANGSTPEVIQQTVAGASMGTLFVKQPKMKARQHWISYGSKIEGTIVVDQGAVDALKANNSLLPVGMTDIQGDFQAWTSVKVVGPDREEVCVGITHYNSDDLRRLIGAKSDEIEARLGHGDYDVVIHVDNMICRR